MGTFPSISYTETTQTTKYSMSPTSIAPKANVPSSSITTTDINIISDEDSNSNSNEYQLLFYISIVFAVIILMFFALCCYIKLKPNQQPNKLRLREDIPIDIQQTDGLPHLAATMNVSMSDDDDVMKDAYGGYI